jgi:hypothetical protein
MGFLSLKRIDTIGCSVDGPIRFGVLTWLAVIGGCKCLLNASCLNLTSH